MKRVLLFVSCFLFAAGSGLAMDFSLSDSSMVWTNQMWLGMSISNIAVEAGVDLKLYVDIDGNGNVNGDDFLLAAFEVDDGALNPFGAQTLVDDKDGVTNGAIETAVSLFGISYNYLHTIGDYVWEAVEIDENDTPISTATATFEVTQPTGTVWVSGSVRDQGSSNLVAGAFVELEYFSDAVGMPPSTWTDTAGGFTLYLPDGVSTNDVGIVLTSAKGMMSVDYYPTPANPVSGHVVTQALTIGENVLPDLYVVPASQGLGLYEVQGTVYWVEQWGPSNYETNTISGVMVACELDEDDPEVSSWDVSDANGQFSLVVPGDEAASSRDLWCESFLLNLRGIVGSFVSVEVTGTVSGVEIYLYNANALIRGRVETEETSDPLTGIELFFEAQSNNYTSSAFTLTNGVYEVGLRAGTYFGQCEYDSLSPLGYLFLPPTNGLVVNEGTVVSNINFQAEPGYPVSGHVFDTNNNPLTEGCVELVQGNEWGEFWIGDTDVRFDGYYTLLSPTGDVYVRTGDFGDYYIDEYHSNQVLCAIGDVNPLATTTNGLSGIDFHLATGARLEGSVLFNGTDPAEWLRIDALALNASNEWTCIGGGGTEWGGGFGFAVPAGQDVYLRTEVDYARWVPRTWYGDTCSGDLATPLSVSTGVTASNLNIAASSGFRANGEVQAQSDLSLLSGAGVIAFDSQSNRYDAVYTDTNGHYDLYLPTNATLVVYADTAGYEGEFYQDSYDPVTAQPFQNEAAYNNVYTPFILYATATDSDGDGLADYLEDRVPDGAFNGGDDYSDPIIKDTDGDGANDGDEYIAGTSAQNSSSLFQIVDGEFVADSAWLAWSSVAGRHYTVKFSEDLLSGSWSNLYSVTASGPLTSFTNALPGDSGYLRIEVSSE